LQHLGYWGRNDIESDGQRKSITSNLQLLAIGVSIKHATYKMLIAPEAKA
jgi:hypothetical protein